MSVSKVFVWRLGSAEFKITPTPKELEDFEKKVNDLTKDDPAVKHVVHGPHISVQQFNVTY